MKLAARHISAASPGDLIGICRNCGSDCARHIHIHEKKDSGSIQGCTAAFE